MYTGNLVWSAQAPARDRSAAGCWLPCPVSSAASIPSGRARQLSMDTNRTQHRVQVARTDDGGAALNHAHFLAEFLLYFELRLWTGRGPGPSPLVENVYFEIHFIYVPKFQNVVFTVKGCYTGHFTMSSFVNVNNDIEENCRSRSILGIVNQKVYWDNRQYTVYEYDRWY